jgi:response regulator RpfG family c-di-GMP phosphodiesterase
MSDKPAVLCVDDELNVLIGLERVLGSRFRVTKTSNSVDATVALQYGGPFAVVVSDFRLVETTGVRLLAQLRDIAPDTVRLLLTGQAGMDDTISAINEGHVYGFIRKPCRPELLLEHVTAAAAHHRLLVNERELLEKTLHGAVRALTDALALTRPTAAARATRLTRYACDLASALKLEHWEIEIAAMVSQIGCATLDAELAERICRGSELTRDEQVMAARLPEIAANILSSIPRLEGVCEILRRQIEPAIAAPATGTAASAAPIGARILRLVSDFDTLDSRGIASGQAVAMLSAARGLYDATVLDALSRAAVYFGASLDTLELPLSEVSAGMIFVSDVYSPMNILLVGRGQAVTPALEERIRNHWISFADRTRVRVVRSQAQKESAVYAVG